MQPRSRRIFYVLATVAVAGFGVLVWQRLSMARRATTQITEKRFHREIPPEEE
jgi:hypothetical protein